MDGSKISLGFKIAALMNIGGVLIFSRCFTNSVIPQSDPVVMSNFGLLMVMVWGMAYFVVSRQYKEVKWLVLIFALEKLIYAVYWTRWILQNEISLVYRKDMMAGIFFAAYGIIDWVFFIFFLYVFLSILRQSHSV
jgi:hypothetical protein